MKERHDFNPATDRCEKCKFWWSPNGTHGECRHRSPRSTRDGAVWPDTGPDLWCGDFAPSVASTGEQTCLAALGSLLARKD